MSLIFDYPLLDSNLICNLIVISISKMYFNSRLFNKFSDLKKVSIYDINYYNYLNWNFPNKCIILFIRLVKNLG